MEKPELSDFELNEELVETYKIQQSKSKKLIDDYLANRKNIKKGILIGSIVVTIIAFIILAATGFDLDATGYVMGICLIWDVIYIFIYVQIYAGEFEYISDEKRKEIEFGVVDIDLRNKVNNFNNAFKKYEKSLEINEKSIVKVELLLPTIRATERSLGVNWLVFSNIHLANPRSYPDIEMDYYNFHQFEKDYENLIEKQKTIEPKPKKYLQLPADEKLKFFYPCSNVYIELEGNKAGDVVNMSIGTRYKILQVINLE